MERLHIILQATLTCSVDILGAYARLTVAY